VNIEQLKVKKTDTLKDVIHIIDINGLGIAFVVDDDEKVIGTVTDSDIRQCLIKGENISSPVETICFKHFFSLPKKFNKENIIKTLSDDVISRIPIKGTMRVPIIDKEGCLIDVAFISEQGLKGRLFNGKPTPKHIKTVLVVGGAGYLGSVLCKELLIKGYKVKVLDNLTYGDVGIKHLYGDENYTFIFGDMRNIQTVVSATDDVDAVIHLAAIVGDPACSLNPEETIENNYLATKMLGEVCKYKQINRFIFASTCSVYGESKGEKELTEKDITNPISLYAQMKLMSEEGLLELKDNNFSPTILRMGTLFGIAQRMRFDLVVNLLTIRAFKTKEFAVFGGNQWRPFLHVKDAAGAYVKMLEAPIDLVGGEIFNVSHENYTINNVGKEVYNVTGAKMNVDEQDIDKRDYFVSTDKIKKIVNFVPSNTIANGIQEIIHEAKQGKYNDWNKPKYSNYQYLIGT